jgi:hypothetical protein
MDLARLDGQVDVVVGDQVPEALGDAVQFESQRNLPGSGGLGWGIRRTGSRGDDLTTGAGLLS